MSVFSRFHDGPLRTAKEWVSRLDRFSEYGDQSNGLNGSASPETIEALEEILISADVGVSATEHIVAAVRNEWGDGKSLRELIAKEIIRIFEAAGNCQTKIKSPRVILVVGVNGTGKTTTVGKLAKLLSLEGKNSLICAGDTFRAAAGDQLEIWAHRAGAGIVRGQVGTDPAAVVFDAIRSGKAQSKDVIIIDTAGRMHNRVNLMTELGKIRRVASRQVDGAPHEVLLVLDATVGQNGLIQAREFVKLVGANGVVLTKIDGTAKAGIAIAIAAELKIPVRYVGIGEGIDDLLLFSERDYVNTLFEVS